MGTTVAPVLHTADFALAWPRELFVDEARALLYDRTDGRWIESAQLLLEEAFAGSGPRDALCANSVPGPWELGPRGFIEVLVEQADQLREAAPPKPYWSQRRGGTVPLLSIDAVMDDFVVLVDGLQCGGYFQRAFPRVCVDDHESYAPDPSQELKNLLGRPDLWPLYRSRRRWDQDLFFDLVEALHDLVARPRSRSFHDFGGCGWHYTDFAVEPGQRLYRWTVNRLLGRSTVAFRLADEGEDLGRLVAVTDDARAELVSKVAEREGATADQVRHALSLFRARGATAHDKRSAILALAGVLEERRQLIREHLSQKDESALFQIANGFALRHQRAGQRADYDPVFLDWIFWWYLATIELSDRLIERGGTPQP